MDAPYPTLEHTDLTEQTYAILKERILTRHLEPGEKIAVPDIAHALGVSRTPVTDALKRLASEGLVEIVPRRGTFVTELTARDVDELFSIRMIIELYAAEYILNATADGKVDQLLAATEGPMQGMEHAIEDGDYRDYEAFIINDRDLHLALVKLTGNQHLIRIYSGLNVHMRVARAHYLNNVEDARQAQREHEAIFEAFRAGDAEEVERALAAHISNVKRSILKLLERRGGRL
jgi:DNA-binding GntR family transcriptional regulator